MGRLSEKQLLIVTIAGGVLLVLLCGGGIYWLHTDRAEILVEVQKLELQVAERHRMEKENGELRLKFDLKSFKDEEAFFDKQLPVETPTGDTEFVTYLNKQRGGLPVLIRKVEAVVERAGTGGFPPPPGVRKMVYRVELRGRFYDVIEYLSALENDDRILRIEHFLFKKKQSTGGSDDGKETLVDATVRVIGFEYATATAAKSP